MVTLKIYDWYNASRNTTTPKAGKSVIWRAKKTPIIPEDKRWFFFNRLVNLSTETHASGITSGAKSVTNEPCFSLYSILQDNRDS